MGESRTEHEALSRDFVAELNRSITEHWASQRRALAHLGNEISPMFDALERLSNGGKRMRALLAYWGWRSAAYATGRVPDSGADPVTLGMSLELFHAAALIHDDIIDRSDTRRGAPSVHKGFERLHQREGWHLDAGRFGMAAGILTGDLCLASSEELFGSLSEFSPHFAAARTRFNLMRSEVMAGQYLDVQEEAVGPGYEPEHAVNRAMNVLTYKSAQYSVVHPLVLGALLGGADSALTAGLEEFALPVGKAFQLRDDVLGVFGDPQVTGKPAGDDVREGKRTVLIAHTLAAATPQQREWLGRELGRADLSAQDIDAVRRLMEDTGALAATESLIDQLRVQAEQALRSLNVDELTRAALSDVAVGAMSRAA